MNEQWLQWKPIEGLSKIYYINSIFNTTHNLKIELTQVDKKHKIVVLFKNFVDTYRITYETYRCKLVSELGEKHGDYFYNWTFFKVTNSSYIRWLSKQSNDAINLTDAIHFSFIEDDFVLDVIATYDPIVEIINE